MRNTWALDKEKTVYALLAGLLAIAIGMGIKIYEMQGQIENQSARLIDLDVRIFHLEHR